MARKSKHGTDEQGGSPPSTTFLGVRLHLLDEQGIAESITDALRRGGGMTVAYAHFDILLQARKSRGLRDALNSFSLTHIDGHGCAAALRLARGLRPPSVAGSDLYEGIVSAAARLRRRIFFLGGSEETARGMLAYWERAGGEAETAASHHGFITPGGADVPARIVEHRPDLILVGMGSPLQFYMLQRLREELPGSVLIATGGGLDFLSGTRSRGPAVLRRLGLEWTHRLFTHPSRYARRYLLGIPLFTLLTLRETLRRCMREAQGPPSPR